MLWQTILFLLFQQIFTLDEIPEIENPNIDFIREYMTQADVIVRPSGLRYRILATGPENGKSPEKNSACECKYVGKNVWGQVFDTSGKKGKDSVIFYPNEVIKGFGEALMLMKEGDRWEIVVPADIGYGKHAKGVSIPSGATLIFDLELVSVGEPKPTSFFKREYLMWILAIGYFIYNYYMSQSKVNEMKKKTPVPIETVQGLPQNQKVFLSIAIDDHLLGDIEFELFSTICPKTVENFRCLCTGEKGIPSSISVPLHYKGSNFHRIIPNFMCQGGDITHHNGTGGESIYGSSFDDEFDNGYIPHSVPYLLSMANAGPNTNSSQFFITLAKTAWLDENHVVFGRATKGIEIIQQMAATGTTSGKPRVKVAIVNCGEIETKQIGKNKTT
jgi:peptidylprolyl isomerase